MANESLPVSVQNDILINLRQYLSYEDDRKTAYQNARITRCPKTDLGLRIFLIIAQIGFRFGLFDVLQRQVTLLLP